MSYDPVVICCIVCSFAIVFVCGTLSSLFLSPIAFFFVCHSFDLMWEAGVETWRTWRAFGVVEAIGTDSEKTISPRSLFSALSGCLYTQQSWSLCDSEFTLGTINDINSALCMAEVYRARFSVKQCHHLRWKSYFHLVNMSIWCFIHTHWQTLWNVYCMYMWLLLCPAPLWNDF